MTSVTRTILDWLDVRTGYRVAWQWLAAEPLPAGVNWWFVLGSILLFLLATQAATGVVLTMFYAPTPDHAYASIRHLEDDVPLGRLVRALHYFGASFIIVAAVAHLLRVFVYGAFKRPRELTWVTGVVLLLVMLAFGLTGYLLPWDQRAYWATVVTISAAGSTPLVGETLAAWLRGGAEMGALTLSRWFAAHVVILPAALALFAVAHLLLLRRHGTAGPIRPHAGPPLSFYPYHAIRDTLAIAGVFAALVACAVLGHVPLDEPANPSDSGYIPRPEWYFLGLFQLVKFFPGALRPLGTVVIPGLLVVLLFLVPFLDRRPERRPAGRPAACVTAIVVILMVVGLTSLGFLDTPRHPDPRRWGPRSLGGRVLAGSDRCTRCHAPGAEAAALDATIPMTRDEDWILAHVSDPERLVPQPRPPRDAVMTRLEGLAVIAYLRKLQVGASVPDVARPDQLASVVFARRCSACHAVDGEGARRAPDLSRAGRQHAAAWLRRWITNPAVVNPATEMPAFGKVLTPDEMNAIVDYLARRK